MASPVPPDLDGVWATIGREQELRSSRAALAGAGVIVCSPWGMGASSFARVLVPRPWKRLVVTAPMGGEHLFAVRTLLGAGGDARDPITAADRLRAAAADAPGRPVALVHGWNHLDGGSEAILTQLVSEGVLRLVAVREAADPLGPDAEAAWRSIGLQRVDLLRLPEGAMASVLDHLLPGPAEGRTRQELIRLAAGTPRLLVEIVDASRQAGVLGDEGGLWRLQGAPTLSPTAVDLARRSMAALDPDGGAAAEVLALAGALPASVLAEVAGPTGAESLERAGLARSVAGGEPGTATVELCDPILIAHLVDTVPTTARLRITSALATATDRLALDADPALFVRSAEWSLASGRLTDPQRLLRAARMAIDLGDPGRAERLAAASGAASPTTEAALLESWCADECGAVDRSERVLAEHRPVGDEAIVAVAIRRAEQRFWTHGDPAAASDLLTAAHAAVAAPWDAAIDAQRAMFDLIDGHTTAALATALPLARHDTRLVSSTASLAAALALVMDDRAVEATAVAEKALAGLGGIEPALYIDPGVHIISLCFSYDGQGRWDEADELTSAVYRHALNRPGRQAQGWAALVRARVLTARGRPVEAQVVALEAEQIWRSANLAGVARWSATVAAQAAATAGDLATVDECLKRIDATAARPFRLFEPEVERVRAWAACLGGDRSTASAARARLADVAVAAADDGRTALGSLAAFDLVRLGDAPLAATLLEALAERSASTVALLRSQVAAAVVGADAPRLEELAATWTAAGAPGTAAECLAYASVAQPARAAALAPRIAELTDGTGLRTPPLRAVDALHERQSLTPREREIVALVAEGYSNRAIADQLVVSTRTVENHLHRAFAKLGVSSRAELAVSTGA